MKKSSVAIVVLGLIAVILVSIVFVSCSDEIVVYRVTFDSQGGSDVASVDVAKGLKVDEPRSPTKSDFLFGGWYKEPECTNEWDFDNDIVTSDITLYAKWTANSNVVMYSVTFDTNGGSAVNAQSVQKNGKATMPADPTKDGYSFDSWYAEETLAIVWDFDTPITEDTILYAKWNLIPYIGGSGGYVFYENPNYVADGWRYLEAAPYGWYDGETDSYGPYTGDNDPRFQWGTDEYAGNPLATSTAIGSGASNTSNIVNYHDNLGTLYPGKGDYYQNPTDYNQSNDGTVAAKVCAEYSVEHNGVTYSDWFLPSKDELDLMYHNLRQQELGGFSREDYWSSSEDDASKAWNQNFYNGWQNSGGRAGVCRVRPVRAFQ